MKSLWIVAFFLTIAAALNLGILGITNINVIDSLFSFHGINRILYALMGLAAVYLLVSCKRCMSCMKKK
jgi:uncharacterized membrane protein YuzA (DUF378 family)